MYINGMVCEYDVIPCRFICKNVSRFHIVAWNLIALVLDRCKMCRRDGDILASIIIIITIAFCRIISSRVIWRVCDSFCKIVRDSATMVWSYVIEARKVDTVNVTSVFTDLWFSLQPLGCWKLYKGTSVS